MMRLVYHLCPVDFTRLEDTLVYAGTNHGKGNNEKNKVVKIEIWAKQGRFHTISLILGVLFLIGWFGAGMGVDYIDNH